MDSVVKEEEEEDRLSNLPDDIIHHILSFLDLKSAVQFCTLSRKWENIWTTMPNLIFDSNMLHDFANFVNHALDHRDNHSQVSDVELTFKGSTHNEISKKIVMYANSHNVTKMTLRWISWRDSRFPQWLFSSRSLKHLNLSVEPVFGDSDKIRVPDIDWDFPALEILKLEHIRFVGDYDHKDQNLFSKCVNLKDLTLHECFIDWPPTFTIYAPRLSNLTITETTQSIPMVFNVVAPQLKTLAASFDIHSEGAYSGVSFMRLTTEGFNFLEKANLSWSKNWFRKNCSWSKDRFRKEAHSRLLDLFTLIRSAKYLILDVNIVECLSSWVDRLCYDPCPFDNLKCLTINAMCLKQTYCRTEASQHINCTLKNSLNDTRVRNYLLEKSPNATFTILPQMDLVAKEKKEDRISKLPDDIIHHILAFLDMKYAVQTSTLAKRWKSIWTSCPYLKFNSETVTNFSDFVADALYNRDNYSPVSSVEFTFKGTPRHETVQEIVMYGYLHNATQLTLNWIPTRDCKLPRWLFSSRSLKYLNLNDEQPLNVSTKSFIGNVIWDFPALETLKLGNIRLGGGNDKNLDLFSKCVNLKDLTLHQCSMDGLESFNVYAPQLSNLTITETTGFPIVFNVVAPQLKTLSESFSLNTDREYSSCFSLMRTKVFNFLEKVNISLSKNTFIKDRRVIENISWTKNNASQLLDLFRTIRSAKYLILDVNIIECLSSCMDQISQEPCPFDNLKCLTINAMCLEQNNPTSVPSQIRNTVLKNSLNDTQVRNYFLETSPNATFIVHLPQMTASSEDV